MEIDDGYVSRQMRCLLVIGTRPLHLPRYWPVIPTMNPPPAYFGLLGLLGVEMWTCPPLNLGLTSTLIAHYLQVPASKVPTQLALAVHTVARGMPKGVRKLIHALHSRKRVHVRERRKSRHSTGAGEPRRTWTGDREGSAGHLQPAKPHRGETAPEQHQHSYAVHTTRQVKVDLNGLQVLPLPNWAQRVVAEALDRASPAAVVVMKAAAVLAVGGGAWCLHFSPVMLLDLHPSVQASGVPEVDRANSASARLKQHEKRFGDEGGGEEGGDDDADGDGPNGIAGRGRGDTGDDNDGDGDGDVRQFSGSISGRSGERRPSGQYSVASSRGSHVVQTLGEAMPSYPSADRHRHGHEHAHHAASKQHRRMRLW